MIVVSEIHILVCHALQILSKQAVLVVAFVIMYLTTVQTLGEL